jgi:hypothetical protein
MKYVFLYDHIKQKIPLNILLPKTKKIRSRKEAVKKTGKDIPASSEADFFWKLSRK